MEELKDLAVSVVQRAVKAGATGAECILREGDEFAVTLRKSQVETLKEAASKGIGLRVLDGKRAASCYTSDFSPAGIDRLVHDALAAVRYTSEDPAQGLPEPELLGQIQGDLKLYSNDLDRLGVEERIDLARRGERAALDFDPRIQNSDGASFDAASGHRIFANSAGFVGEYRRSYCSLSVVPIAVENGSGMQRDYWFSIARSLAGLEKPEEVGRIAAQRALRRLNARKLETTRAAVIFDPLTSGGLIGSIFEAVNGDSVYRGASYLAKRLGEQVASPLFSIVDDGTMPGGFGTTPFDDEGVPTRRTSVIERGELKSFLLNCYTARKLGMKTTGNASRGLAGNPGVGPGNFYLEAGSVSPDEIIASTKRGLYVVETIGQGINLVTGDYSRGVAGLWIENGEVAYPVEEVTIAGNLLGMLRGVEAIGSDLEFRGSIAAPTIKIGEMTIAGR